MKLALIPLLLVVTPANAQTQAQMNASSALDARRADAAMNAQWKRTLADMKARDAQNTSRGGGFGFAAALLASQRAWLKFRDSQCVIQAGEFAGGSMQPMAQANCLARLSGERTRQLKDLMWQR